MKQITQNNYNKYNIDEYNENMRLNNNKRDNI